jgi:hypothetical protein
MLSKSIIRCAAALSLAGYVFVYASGRAQAPIRSDGFSYFVYLPSWFIFHDPTLAATARDCCGGRFPEFTGITRWPGTRRWVNVHPIGVAVMQAPLFLAAHALTRWTNLSPDGFSLYYQHAAGVSGTIWIVMGLWVLGRLLRRHFSDGVTAATLVTILLGTNLFHYATFDSTYSHAYSFFLFAAFLELTERWYQRPDVRGSVLLGVAGGLIVLVRHTNVLFLSVFLLYGAAARPSRAVRDRLGRHIALAGISLLVAALVVSPQLAMYHQATGRFLMSSYGELGFNWKSPQIFGVLFSVQKGLFFWSPVLLAGAAGLLGLLRSGSSARVWAIPAILVLAADTCVIASWWDWQFGASYGHRGFVDVLPLFAVGLASFYTWASRVRLRRWVVSTAAACLIALSIFQMLQYWNGVLPHSDMTWDRYRAIFLRLR